MVRMIRSSSGLDTCYWFFAALHRHCFLIWTCKGGFPGCAGESSRISDACERPLVCTRSGGDPQRNVIGRLGLNACSMQSCLGGYSVPGELFSQVFRASLPVTIRCLDQDLDKLVRGIHETRVTEALMHQWRKDGLGANFCPLM